MQALLSFDQAPPLAGPLRFFLTAPLCSALAGLLLLVVGPELLASRWTPGALAFTHLLTVGFMLQTMVGALLQILPVVTGATVPRTLGVARLVHGLLTIGLLLLLGGFLFQWPPFFQGAALLLGSGVAIFLAAVGLALHRVPVHSPVQWSIKLATSGLGVAVLLGLVLASSLAKGWGLPLLELTEVHLAWGLIGWGVLLLSGIAYVVVPMFLLTPGFPEWLSRLLAPGLFLGLALWSGATAAGLEVAPWLARGLAIGCGAFAGVTLGLLIRSKRAKQDVTQRYWRLGLAAGLAALGLWVASHAWGGIDQWPALAVGIGVLILVGGFMSVITGMLYKIVPFLIWLHLQNAGQGRVLAPNMKKVLAEKSMSRQLKAHALALAALLGAVLWPAILARPAGLLLLLSSLGLVANLLAGLQVYRHHLADIQRRLAAPI